MAIQKAWRAVLGISILMAASSLAAADEVEVRDFSITIDGKPAGSYQMTIRQKDDGTAIMAGKAETKVTVLLITAYSFTYDGREVWKDGRLQKFDSSGAENGKRYTINAVAEGDRLKVIANGKPTTVRPDVWVNTYWRLPAAGVRGGEVALLGCDTGKESPAVLKLLGPERISVAGQDQNCVRYRIMTTPPHDLWFDAQERLVKQEWVSDGHPTVLELVRVRR